jgi:hypothetical protein
VPFSLRNIQVRRHRKAHKMTALIYGPCTKVRAFLVKAGLWPEKWHPSEGPFPGPKITGYTGGYDDYGGAWGWLEVDASIIPADARKSRFSPDPGRWLNGYDARQL